jgi:drug/metabolite transporter (DMT)-like permease
VLELRRDDADVSGSTLTPRIALLMTLPPLLWAGNAIVGRLMVGLVPPLTLNALRWALTALLLAPLAARAWRHVRTLRNSWRYLLAIGTLGVGSFNALQYLALETSTPLNVTLINASMPMWMLVVGALLWRERPAGRAAVGAVLSLAGVATVVARGQWADLARVQFVVGDAYMLTAVIGWALYSWLLVRPPAWMFAGAPSPPRLGLDWAAFLFVQALFGLVAAGGASAFEVAFGSHAPIDWGNAKVLAALAFVAIGPSIVAYRFWALGVTVAGPAIAAFFSNLSPLFAALLSAWLLGQWPEPYHAVAFGLIVAGIAVSAWQRS